MAVEDCYSVDLQRNPGGMGYPLRLKRVAILIPAQTTWWTRVEEPQVEHGVEVRVREWRRHVNVSKVSQPKHETQCSQAKGKADKEEALRGKPKSMPQNHHGLGLVLLLERLWSLETSGCGYPFLQVIF